MTTTTAPKPSPSTASLSAPSSGVPGHFQVTPADAAFFEQHLRSFVPPGGFDAHGHLYNRAHADGVRNPGLATGPQIADWPTYQKLVGQWMGDRAPTGGLFFAFPERGTDFAPANVLIAEQIRQHQNLRGLLFVKPDSDPAEAERQLVAGGFSGLKVYHLYAPGLKDTFLARTEQFLTDWMWELCDRRGLAIMLHIVLPRALADPINQRYIREHCERYPNARLILAHAARSFNSLHTFNAIESLRGLDNVWFDCSAVCEPHGIEAIFKTFGTTRMMFGLDFPVSQLRGRAINIADGFLWIDDKNVDWSKSLYGQPTLIGNEATLAFKTACRNQHLNDSDIERVFITNAQQLLGIGAQPDGHVGQDLYREAKKIIPGGTQLLSKRPEKIAPEVWPPYYREARGCQIIDIDGRSFIDMSNMSVGACLLGYSDPDVNDAVMRRVQLGVMSSLNCPDEVALAKIMFKLHPWAQQARFSRGGGDTMTIAVRIARAATGRDVVAFCGYHGWYDWYLATNVGPVGRDRLDGHLMAGLNPAGVPHGLADTAFPFAYNQLDQLKDIVSKHGKNLAAIVMEPIRYADPKPGFLEGVRELADRTGAALIFDEITIGWKLAVGGAHLKLGVNPDIAAFAKSTGNGHPIGAVIGVEKFMRGAQESFISSTFYTEGVGYAAALATIAKMQRLNLPPYLEKIGLQMKQAWRDLAKTHKLDIQVGGHPALAHFSVNNADNDALSTLFTARMLKKGFLAGFGFYVSYAHQPRHVQAYAEAADEVFAEMADAVGKGDAAQRIGSPVKQAGFARLT